MDGNDISQMLVYKKPESIVGRFRVFSYDPKGDKLIEPIEVIGYRVAKNSAIVRTLLSGTTVYVIDTYIESPERMWCKINYDGATGWISYNTINGSIK